MESRFKSSKLALVMSVVLVPCAASALPPVGATTVTRTEAVRFDPSQVSTREGAAKLYARLQRAAHRVCEDVALSLRAPLAADPGHAACVREAMDRAVADLAVPLVVVVHRYGAQGPTVVVNR